MKLNQNDQTLAAQFTDWNTFDLYYNPQGIEQSEANTRLGLAIGQYLEDLKEAITDYTDFGGTIDGVGRVIREFNQDIEDYADNFGIEGYVTKENFVRLMGRLVQG